MASRPYPADLLVETDWLADRLRYPDLVIVDMDIPQAHAKAHIPGAVSAGPNYNVKSTADPRVVAPPEQAKQHFESLGIGDGTPVVVYDNNRSNASARLWWVLRYYGHDNVRVLNGGWLKWTREGRPIEVTPSARGGQSYSYRQPPAARRRPFTPRPQEAMLDTVETLKAAIGQPGEAVWDVRAADEYAGTNARGNKRVGHVPGAVHMEWVDVVNEADHTFRPPGEIARLLQQAGLSPEQRVHTYCQGGIRAAHSAFTLALMGFPRVRMYDGSMGEWANRDDTPLEMPRR